MSKEDKKVDKKIKQVSRAPHRLEGELKYDYCCRRMLDKQRLAIISRGRVFYGGATPYVKRKGMPKMSKKQKKAFKKATRAYKFKVNTST